jgi:biotin synthase
MAVLTKQEILEILAMPRVAYESEIMPRAKEIYIRHGGNRLVATAMLGFDNVCKNQCLYCGMRAGNTAVKRYRIEPADVIRSAACAGELGFRRLFLVSGEDPKYGFDRLLEIVSGVKALGMHLSLACGELERAQYQALRDAGTDEYVMKFEMSDRETFNRLNPSTDFDRRMQSAAWVRESGMKLASGNIVDYPGHTLSQIADDILLMRDLEISWAPVIPYLPALNTPLAQEGGRGSLELNLKEISILRLMLPDIHITAQQPGENLKNGLADEQGNLDALKAGANMLFADLLPAAQVQRFSVIDNRVTLGLEHIRHMAELANMELSFN